MFECWDMEGEQGIRHNFTIVTSQFYIDGHHVSPDTDNHLIPEYSVDIYKYN